jgi:hypothetical protein
MVTSVNILQVSYEKREKAVNNPEEPKPS